MRAVVRTAVGGPEVLRLQDVPDPVAGPGEVLVRLVRSGVNPTDWKRLSTDGPLDPAAPPQVPGQDGAGVVEAVGAGVDAGLVGRRVWVWEAAFGRPHGTAAELTAVPVHQAVPLPDAAPFELGASLGIPFLTAHRCLTAGASLPDRLGPGALAGRAVLVQGGAGAVGVAALQLARWAGATTLATVSSPEKAQLAAAAGADHVVDRHAEDVAARVRQVVPGGVDAVVEVAAAANAAVDAAVLAPHGAVAAYADDDGQDLQLPVRPLMLLNAAWHFVLVYTAPRAAKLGAVDDVSAAVAAGAVRAGRDAGLPLHLHPLGATADAHRAVQGGAVGKVLLDPTA